MHPVGKNRYESIPKRSFRNGIIRLLEENYKLLGSHKILKMVADDIVELHKEFYPDLSKNSFGQILWWTTGADCKKPSYGTKVEDYPVKTVILPLINKGDVEARIKMHHSVGHGGNNQSGQRQRDIEVMVRLIKSAYEQGGLLSGAELSVLLNRSMGTISKYLKEYHRTHDDILPTKGIVLDQGSSPSHKASIINLYEQGYAEPDIARLTSHTLESVGRYLRAYKNTITLLEKGCGIMEMVRITGKGRSTIIQYIDIACRYNPKLRRKEDKKGGRTTQ